LAGRIGSKMRNQFGLKDLQGFAFGGK